jgi:predicted dehydrogenase
VTKLRAAVVGLGQAGSRFDEEPRKSVWSHVGAYLSLSSLYELAGGADVMAANRSAFSKRCPGLPVFESGPELLKRVHPDVVSVCTPHQGRAQLIASLLEAHRPKVIVCEKPLEVDPKERERLAALCREAGVHLSVHYNRRFLSSYRIAKEMIDSGRLGRLTSITISAPNRLWSVGSHAYNALLYLAGGPPLSWTSLALPELSEGGEPAADLLCRFEGGLAGRVVTAGFKQTLVFEVDILGEEGRLTITDNGARAAWRPLEASLEYSGYRVLGREELLNAGGQEESSFVSIAAEAAELAQGRLTRGASSAETAMASEGLLDSVINITRQDRGAT